MENNTEMFGFEVEQAWKMLGICMKAEKVEGGLALGMDYGAEKGVIVAVPEVNFDIDGFLDWYDEFGRNNPVYLEGIVHNDLMIVTVLKVPNPEQNQYKA